MRAVRRLLIGISSVVFLIGGVTMVTPFGSEAEARGKHRHHGHHGHHDPTLRELAQDHNDLDGKLNMLKDSTDVIEANQDMIKTTQETLLQKLMDLGDGPPVTGGGFPCTSGGTEVGDRWVVSTTGLTVCDKNTNITWEQRPLSLERIWDEGHTYCASLGPDWRMPEEDELVALVDVTQGPPTLPAGHPFENIQSAKYWSGTTSGSGPTSARNVNFNDGNVNTNSKTSAYFIWCARGGI